MNKQPRAAFVTVRVAGRRVVRLARRGRGMIAGVSPGSWMSEQDDEGQLLERLEEAASGESSVRQLRRRYDLLRRDYEVLLDRLSELEERVVTQPSTEPHDATSQPAAPQVPPPAEGWGLLQQVTAPLQRLREEYLAAISAMQQIVGGLDGLARGAMKGQHSASGEPQAPPNPVVESPNGEHPNQVEVTVDVEGSGFGDLLDFQEQLSSLPSVARVSIQAIDSERASFVVELEG